MVSLRNSIEEKYGEEENTEDFGFIVFISSSPEAKRGLFPPIMTLNDYNIECFGDFCDLTTRIKHISELDLTDNLLSDWGEVAEILTTFRSLTFLNLSNNLLNQPLDDNNNRVGEKLANRSSLAMRKLVLNGNNVAWDSVVYLVSKMDNLEELHLSCNNLGEPGEVALKHPNLKYLYLSCNPIDNFSSVSLGLVSSCSSLELLSLAECPVSQLPETEELPKVPGSLSSLNISTTKISSWAEVDKLRQFPGLKDLRIQGCPFLDEYTAHEKRMLLIARLPNVKVLNGGDTITATEREDAERAFIRHFLDTAEDERPTRFQELVAVHGLLDPLVNVDLRPEDTVKVKVYYKEEVRDESVSVKQTVKQFKQLLHSFFNIAPANMRVWYYDQEMTKIMGPEEMKWHGKELYTYNVRDGDYFVVDEKAQLKVLTGSPRAHSISFGSASPTSRYMVQGRSSSTFGHSPTSPVTPNPRMRRKSSDTCPLPPVIEPGNSNRVRRKSSERASPGSGRVSPGSGPRSKSSVGGVARNLFGPSNEGYYGEFHHSKVFHDPGKN